MTHYLLLLFGGVCLMLAYRGWYHRMWWGFTFWGVVFFVVWWALFTHSQSGVWP